MTHKILLLTWCSALFFTAQAQFPPAAGFAGSDAISASDPRFKAWATHATIERGLQDIANPALGYATAGDSSAAVGPAGQNGTVSLGDGGTATLTFDYPIYNGAGFDFAVFENGFATNQSGAAFLEFAFVEVSSDGMYFVRFPAVSNIQDTVQLAMEGIDCSLVNNLGGKYVAGYGTPFDLEELKNEPGLDIAHITHVRLVDVVGSIDPQFATYDSQGHKINDPYPTPFASSGFDLDAVGVLHAAISSGIRKEQASLNATVFPNPASGTSVQVRWNEPETALVTMKDQIGATWLTTSIVNGAATLQTQHLPSGIYWIILQSKNKQAVCKLLVP